MLEYIHINQSYIDTEIIHPFVTRTASFVWGCRGQSQNHVTLRKKRGTLHIRQ